MALDMFVKFEGVTIKGESQAKNHVGETEILAWSWGASQSGSTHYGKGGGAGKANVQDLSFTKWLDGASGDLLQCCAFGAHIDKVSLFMERAGGIDKGQVKLLTLELEDCLISSYSTGGSGGEDRLTENVSINFAKFTFTPYTQGEDGTEAAAGIASYSMLVHGKA